VYREVEERGEVMWGREFKFIGMDPKNKGEFGSRYQDREADKCPL